MAKKTTGGGGVRQRWRPEQSRELVSKHFVSQQRKLLSPFYYNPFQLSQSSGPVIIQAREKLKEPIISERGQNCAMAEPMPGCKLFVGNITERVQKHQLRSDFEKFGRVNEVFIGQGFGFITFDRPG